MKKLIITIIITLITLNTFSQNVDQFLTEKTLVLHDENINLLAKKMNLAGQELIKFHKNYSCGIAINLGSLPIFAIGAFAMAEYEQEYAKGAFITGGLMVLAGTCQIIISHKHLKKAGFVLSGNSLGVNVKL